MAQQLKLREPLSELGTAAVGYAKRGKKILPLHGIVNGRCSCGDSDCQSPAKHPLTKHGLDDATDDIETVKRWWQEHPNANIGLLCGPEAGLVVLDVDPEKGGRTSLG